MKIILELQVTHPSHFVFHFSFFINPMSPVLFHLPFGIPIYGYGLMLVVGFLIATFLCGRLLKRAGENPEHVTNMGMLALIGGGMGGRIFYVVQNWDHFAGDLIEMLKLSSGGLVFYGGFIGGVSVVTWYIWRKKLPVRLFFDAIAPALMLGLAFGRVGCLLNGCCSGAVCGLPWSIKFPYNSLPYQVQAFDEQHGGKDWIRLDEEFWTSNTMTRTLLAKEALTTEQRAQLSPNLMVPVHPTQIYSTINALILCVFSTMLFLYRRRDGQVLLTMMLLYPATRFILEMLRIEPRYTAGLTASQWVSICIVCAGAVLWWFWRRLPAASAIAPQHASVKSRSSRRTG